jgi:hypothetical protein
VALLRRNLCPAGILAATPLPAARARGYAAIFGRDAAICALGMAVAPDATLQREAATGILALARHQARNGQIPKFVDTAGDEADFWYLGCIDATLWWLIAIALLDRHQPDGRLAQRLARQIERAIVWLSCQEHQRFHLLQQNEASDWADIMPRSGFVLYTNALWYVVKRLYRLRGAADTHRNFNQLFYPFAGTPADYRRARLLVHYARHRSRQRELYVSFVNFSFCGDEGDVFGNVRRSRRSADGAATIIVHAVSHARVRSCPVRVVCARFCGELPGGRTCRDTGRTAAVPWGIWPFVGAFCHRLAQAGLRAEAEAESVRLPSERAVGLGVHGMAPWAHACAAGHGRPIVERRELPARGPSSQVSREAVPGNAIEDGRVITPIGHHVRLVPCCSAPNLTRRRRACSANRMFIFFAKARTAGSTRPWGAC